MTAVFTFSAGVQWSEAYEAARQYNRDVVGAVSQSVGAAGGWLTGGGHSAISPNYGLGKPNPSAGLSCTHRLCCRRGQRIGDIDCDCRR